MNVGTGLSPGTVLAGRYEIQSEIGRGERSIVFEALDTQRERRVAVKLLSPLAAIAHLTREQLRRYSDELASVQHAGILKPIELLEAGLETLIVMEQADGSDLGSRVAAQGPLSPHEVAEIGRCVAEALAAAHARGLLHRGVKPSNVLLPEAGAPLLTDFGCSNLDGQEAPLEDQRPASSIGFLSPELLQGSYTDARSDIYALGMTLYHALVGELPAELQETERPVHLSDGFHPALVRPDVPPWLDQIIARATCAEPSCRIETAETLARALDEQGLPGGVGTSREAYLADCCILCREPGTLGRAVCPHCEDAKTVHANTLLKLVAPNEQMADDEERVRKLRGLTGSPGDERAVRRVARGKQPLVKLSRSQAQRVSQRLSAYGFESRLVPVDSTWAELPDWLVTLALIPIGLGFALALRGDAVLFGAGLAGGLVLLPLGHSLMQHPPLIPDPTGPRPAPSLAQKVAEVMPEIQGGEARKLLAEILRLSRDISLRLENCADSAETGEALVALGLSACDAARELATMDPILDALMLHGEHRFEPPPGLLESRARLGTARSCLAQYLLETTATLSVVRGVEILDAAEIRGEIAAIHARLDEELDSQRVAVKQAFSLFPLRSTPVDES